MYCSVGLMCIAVYVAGFCVAGFKVCNVGVVPGTVFCHQVGFDGSGGKFFM